MPETCLYVVMYVVNNCLVENNFHNLIFNEGHKCMIKK